MDWDEEDHPRDDDGKFASGGGGGDDDEDNDEDEYTSQPVGGESASALYEYQNYAHGKINKTLRSGESLDAKGAGYVAAIDEAFEAQKEESVYLFRGDGAGLSVAMFDSDPLPADFKVTLEDYGSPKWREAETMLNQRYAGKTFRDQAYVSTSRSEKLAMDKFVGGSYEVNRFGATGLVRISGKSKVLHVDSLTGMKAGEQEALLPRGTTFKVNMVKIDLHPDGKRVFLDWRVSVT